MAQLEHANVTVADPQALAALLGDLFGWKIRWEGAALDGIGYTVHVGTDDTYLALYTGNARKPVQPEGTTYNRVAGLNHIGIVVDDLDAAEARVRSLGLIPNSHADYEPGRRFYFDTPHQIEIEVISYA